MSRQFSDFQLGQITLFFGMIFGAVLTVLLPGPAKLIYIKFQLMCTILLLLSLLVPKSKGEDVPTSIQPLTESDDCHQGASP